jgi:hypothetical protein
VFSARARCTPAPCEEPDLPKTPCRGYEGRVAGGLAVTEADDALARGSSARSRQARHVRRVPARAGECRAADGMGLGLGMGMGWDGEGQGTLGVWTWAQVRSSLRSGCPRQRPTDRARPHAGALTRDNGWLQPWRVNTTQAACVARCCVCTRCCERTAPVVARCRSPC